MSVRAMGLGSPRNGLAERKPYVYRGVQRGLTPEEWNEDAAQMRRPPPPRMVARCEKCGYRAALCCCQGGPRG